MYALKKFQLINWHTISNSQVVTLSPKYTLLVGANRSGKSTIVDALTTCLFFNTSQYNTATGDKGSGGKRTDIGYVRAYDLDKQTAGNSFLDACRRKGEVVSYILIEVDMPGSHLARKAILGLEQYAGKGCVETGTLNKQWFIIKNHGLEELNLFRENELRQKFPKRLSDVLADFNPSEYIAADRQAMEGYFASYLGLSFSVTRDSSNLRNYASLFEKMKSFKIDSRMRNSDYIVREGILKREVIDIDGMRADQQRSQEAYAELVKNEEKLRELKAIIDISNELRDLQKQERYAEAAKVLLNAKNAQAKIDAAENAMIQTREDANEAAEKEKSASKHLSDLESTKRLMEGFEEYSAMRPIQERIEDIKASIQSATESGKQFAVFLKELCRVAHAVNEAYGATKLDDMLMDKYAAGEDVTLDDVDQLCEQLNRRAKELFDIVSDLRVREQMLGSKLAEYRSEIAALEVGRVVPDNRDCEVVKALIDKDFKDAGIADVPMYLCELVEINDPVWSEAAERYMGGARFNICVSPENYERACEIERSYRNSDRKKRGNVWIADMGKAVEDMKGVTVAAGTLATVIDAKNEYVRAYVDRAYGRVYLTDDTVHPADKSRTYLAADGSVYVPGRHGSNRPVARLVIGSKARTTRLALLKREADEMQDEYALVRSKVSGASGANAALNTSSYRNASTRIIQEYKNVLSIDGLEKELAEEQKKLKKYEGTSIQQQIVQLERQIDEQKAKYESLSDIRRRMDKKASEAEAVYNAADEENAAQKKAADELRLEKPDVCAGAEQLIASVKEELHTNRTERILRRAEEIRAEAHENAVEKDISLRALQAKYAQDHVATNCKSRGLVDMDVFAQAYETLSSIDVPLLRRKMEVANENARNIFFTNVIGNLCCQIRSAQRLFRERNKWLAYCSMDGNVFQIKDVKAHPSYEDEYNAIIALGSGNPAQYIIGEDADERRRNNEIADRLFEKLCEEPDPTTSSLLDYRTYCSFGMEVLRVDPDTGIIDKSTAKSFEKWLAIGSGGQVELPLYIVLGVALSNACAGNSRSISDSLDASDSIRLCVIDEALVRCDGEFSKMVLRFLTERLGLQLITVAPSDQFERLSYGVGKVLLVENDPSNGLRYVRQMQYAEFEQAMGVDAA